MSEEIYIIDGDDRARLRALMAIAFTVVPALTIEVPVLDIERKRRNPADPAPVGMNRHERRAMNRKGRK